MRKFLTLLVALIFLAQTSWASAVFCADSAMGKAQIEQMQMDCHTQAEAVPQKCPLQKLSDCYDVDDLSKADSQKLKSENVKQMATYIEPALVHLPKVAYAAHSRAPPDISHPQTSLILTTARIRL